jgi:hypothetical protein
MAEELRQRAPRALVRTGHACGAGAERERPRDAIQHRSHAGRALGHAATGFHLLGERYRGLPL